ncbi:MAG TPA: sulfatase-like hydrolase/transferase, partial [Candidatus Polarisedimenticolaceae bacterium]|nr:sulfatase-like hydrolase/transferase [Candidatus Polarisedimenticolaceae bacterium]
EDDFVSAEIRRHGVLAPLVSTLIELSIPYVVLGLFAMWAARGLSKLARNRPDSGLVRHEPWIGAGIVAAGLAIAVAAAAIERPASLAGLLSRRGGVARASQLGLERALSPASLSAAATLLAAALAGLAFAGWWKSSSRGGRRAALITASSVALLVPILIFAPRLRRGAHPAADPERPNVLLIVVDSLRPDRAADPAIAPNLAALAARSVRFLDARTPCALTYPAIASLLTGKHPVRHGVRDLYPDASVRDLGKDTLPRALDRAGYRTIAVGGYCATPLRELDSGYSVQATPRSEVELIVSSVAFRGHPWLPAVLPFPWARTLFPQLRTAVEGSHPGDVTREAVTAWRRARGPFFVTVFFDNPHLPYVPVWPDSRRHEKYGGPNQYTLLSGRLVEQIHEGESAARTRESEIERDNARGLYDDAVRSVDRSVGRLLAKLDRDGLTENTMVVVLADHGENLFDDDGSLAHGEAIERDRSNAVPWTIAWPGRLPARDVTSPVLLTDVAPTLLSLLALPALPEADGTDRAPAARGMATDPDRPAMLETGMWFVARESVARLDPSGRGLTYPDFDQGLLGMEPGNPPHVVVAADQRAAVVRAKHRRLEWGPYALTYRPRTTGAAFSLYRRDIDPGLTRDLSKEEPAKRRELIAMFYDEARRLGETEVIPPEEK